MIPYNHGVVFYFCMRGKGYIVNINRCLLFLLMSLCGSEYACVSGAGDQGGSHMPSRRTSRRKITRSTKKTSIKGSPDILKKAIDHETPIKRSQLTLRYIEENHGKQMDSGKIEDAVVEHVENIKTNLDLASQIVPFPRPSYQEEIVGVAVDTQQVLLGRKLSLRDYGTRVFFDKYRKTILTNKKGDLFEKLAQYSTLGYIAAHHAIDGDPGKGGQHFIRTSANHDAFAAATYASGRPILCNVITGVEYGESLRAGHSRSILNCISLTSDDDITQTIAAIARGAIPVIGYTENAAVAIIPAGLPLAGQVVELCFNGTDVVTFYPIFSFAQWRPDQPLNIVTYDVIWAGSTSTQKAVVMSPAEALAFAQTIISQYAAHPQPYCPLAYITDHGTLIFDFAPALQAAGRIAVERGIYVEFQQEDFNPSSLQVAFPTHF